MKKSIITLIAAAAILSSCQKAVPEISQHPFTMSLHYAATSSAWIDVVPENNDFYWNLDVISISDYNAKGSIEACIADTDRELKELYDTIIKEGLAEGSFNELMLYRGADIPAGESLNSKDKYIAYAYAYEEDGTVTGKYQTIQFETEQYIPSDVTFELSLHGTELGIKPSNDDPFFYDYNLKTEIEEVLGEEQSVFYYLCIVNNIYYGFFDFLENRGPVSEDVSEYINLKEGDKFLVFVSGYNHDINTSIYKFECTYAGDDKDGTVTFVEKYDL